MKIFSFLLLSMIFVQSTNAQKDTLQSVELLVSPSLNYRWFSASNKELHWLKHQHDSLQRFSSGFGFQLNHEFGIGRRKSFFMGLAYSKQGYQYKEQAIQGFTSYALNYHFIQFPLGCNFYFRVNEFFQIAVQPSFLPSALLRSVSVYETIDSYNKQRSSAYPSSSNLSLNGQLAFGILTDINALWKFRGQFFYQQQLTPLTKGDLSCRLFSLGLQFGLSRSL
jgi:hypothetical protein